MKTVTTTFALAAAAVSMPAMAQMQMGPRAGSTRAATVTAATTMFAQLDQNGDGSVDTTEATAALQARAEKNGRTFRPRAVTRLMTRSDANGDGKITLDEFQTAAGAQFDQTDANKNGTIDPDEVGAPPAESNHPPGGASQ